MPVDPVSFMWLFVFSVLAIIGLYFVVRMAVVDALRDVFGRRRK